MSSSDQLFPLTNRIAVLDTPLQTRVGVNSLKCNHMKILFTEVSGYDKNMHEKSIM